MAKMLEKSSLPGVSGHLAHWDQLVKRGFPVSLKQARKADRVLVTSVNRQNLAGNLFRVPQGYGEVPIPGLGFAPPATKKTVKK